MEPGVVKDQKDTINPSSIEANWVKQFFLWILAGAAVLLTILLIYLGVIVGAQWWTHHMTNHDIDWIIWTAALLKPLIALDESDFMMNHRFLQGILEHFFIWLYDI